MILYAPPLLSSPNFSTQHSLVITSSQLNTLLVIRFTPQLTCQIALSPTPLLSPPPLLSTPIHTTQYTPYHQVHPSAEERGLGLELPVDSPTLTKQVLPPAPRSPFLYPLPSFSPRFTALRYINHTHLNIN